MAAWYIRTKTAVRTAAVAVAENVPRTMSTVMAREKDRIAAIRSDLSTSRFPSSSEKNRFVAPTLESVTVKKCSVERAPAMIPRPVLRLELSGEDHHRYHCHQQRYDYPFPARNV